MAGLSHHLVCCIHAAEPRAGGGHVPEVGNLITVSYDSWQGLWLGSSSDGEELFPAGKAHTPCTELGKLAPVISYLPNDSDQSIF